MSSLSEIIERVEKASGQSRELDALIECEVRRLQAYAVGLSDETRAHWNPIGSKGEVIDNQGLCRYHSPAYTFSIDTALTLLPEGWEWQVSNRAPEPNAGRAYLHNGELIFSGFGGSQPNPAHKSAEVVASTPAIALVAACLKARLLDAASSEARG